MSFQLKKDNHVWWPVIICEPNDGGGVTEHRCQAKFDILSQDDFDSFAGGGDKHLLTKLLKGFKDIADPDGHDLAFIEENVKALLNIPYVRTSFLRAYMQAAAGAPVKN